MTKYTHNQTLLGLLGIATTVEFGNAGIRLDPTDTSMVLQIGIEWARRHPEYVLAISANAPTEVPEDALILLDHFINTHPLEALP